MAVKRCAAIGANLIDRLLGVGELQLLAQQVNCSLGFHFSAGEVGQRTFEVQQGVRGLMDEGGEFDMGFEAGGAGDGFTVGLAEVTGCQWLVDQLDRRGCEECL